MTRRGYSVRIAEGGRGGEVEYAEGDMRLVLWWEFTAAGAWLWAPSPADWNAFWLARDAEGAVGRRREILERVAAETRRRRAPGARVTIGEDGITLHFD